MPSIILSGQYHKVDTLYIRLVLQVNPEFGYHRVFFIIKDLSL